MVYPTLSYPELDPSILAGLRRVHPLLHDLETQVPASIRTRFKTWVQLVKQFSEGERSMVQMMEIKDERVRSKLALHWWSCEFTLTKGKKTRAQCSNRGVMMACGRVSRSLRLYSFIVPALIFFHPLLQCQSVRYCSEGPSRRLSFSSSLPRS